MSGFTGLIMFKDDTYRKVNKVHFPKVTNGFYPRLESICDDFHCFYYYGIKRLYRESVLHPNPYTIIGLEGVYLNIHKEELRKNLEEQTGKSETSSVFFNILKKAHGSFSGFWFTRDSKELHIFTDQTASRQIFYYSNQDFFAFSSSIFLLSDMLQQLNVNVNLSEQSAYMLLSLGYFLEDHTLVNEIKKIGAGKYLVVNKNGIKIEQYHSFYRRVEFSKINKELLEELATRFKTSVLTEYEYDKSHELNHIANLSGGLDTRMNVMYAWKNGYKNITAFTFSEGMQSDEVVARQISDDIKIPHVIILLNNGLFLFDLDSPLLLNNCAVYYFGSAHTFFAVQKLNFNGLGLMHNGLLAESSKGNYITESNHRAPQLCARYSVSGKYLDRLDSLFKNEIVGLYPDEEMFVHYSRGFNAIHNGSWMTRPFTESVYTFMEPDFTDLAYSISPNLRYNSFLTVEWLKALHPEMAKYNWAPFGIPPTNSHVKNFAQRVRRKTSQILTSDYKGPNPLHHYYKSNEELRNFINDYYNSSNAWPIIPRELKKDLDFLFKTGIVPEKLLCISLLKSIDLLFVNNPV
jgi:asparagine synthase (glutamine-hydrolysing)